MKAEHRKELETNTLADKMGVVMTRVKGSPRRTFLVYLLIFGVVCAGLWFLWRTLIVNRQARSYAWTQLYDGSKNALLELARDTDTYTGKAARFQIAWHEYWEGLKMMRSDVRLSMRLLEKLGKEYQDLADVCKGDPLFEPEALLMIAVVEESRAIQERSRLEGAVKKYEEVLSFGDKKYEKSAQGRFAQSRLDHLKDDRQKQEVVSLLNDLQAIFGVPGAGVDTKLPGFGRKGKPDVEP